MDAAYSKNPRIRLFTVGLNSQTTPQDTVKGRWSEACAESVCASLAPQPTILAVC